MAPSLFERHARTLIVEALQDTRVVFVMGARQVGKSTLTTVVAEQDRPARMLTLDDRGTRAAALTDPTGFVGGLDSATVIDEVQRAPDLLLAIKEAVDRDPRPGRFLLTGSANVLSNRKVKDALTGRMEIVRLWPLSQAGIQGTTNNFVDALFATAPPQISNAPVGRAAFVDLVAAGGYPEARRREGRRRVRWFRDYLDTTLDRDLRDVSDALKLAHAAALKPDGRGASPNSAAGDGPRRTNVMAEPTPENLERLARLLDAGTLKVPIQHSYRLEDAAAALPALGTTHTQGKHAIKVA